MASYKFSPPLQWRAVRDFSIIMIKGVNSGAGHQDGVFWSWFRDGYSTIDLAL